VQQRSSPRHKQHKSFAEYTQYSTPYWITTVDTCNLRPVERTRCTGTVIRGPIECQHDFLSGGGGCDHSCIPLFDARRLADALRYCHPTVGSVQHTHKYCTTEYCTWYYRSASRKTGTTVYSDECRRGQSQDSHWEYSESQQLLLVLVP
jgi:hypothetical protein